MEKETHQLIERLEEIENEIITDEDIEKAIIESLKDIEKIYGKGIGDKIREVHQIKNLEKEAKKTYLKTKTNFKDYLSIIDNETNKIKVHKLGIILKELKKNHPKKHQIEEIEKYFENREEEFKHALEKKNINEANRNLQALVDILEKEKEYLMKNKSELTSSRNNLFSLQNILLHEFTHSVFNLESTLHWSPLNEAYSFAMQRLNHIYRQKDKIDAHQLEYEIHRLKNLSNNLNRNIYKIHFEITQQLIMLIGISVLSDVIDRQEGHAVNHQILLQTYKTARLKEIHQLIIRQIDGIRENDLKNILKRTEIATIDNLKRQENQIENQIERYIRNQEDFASVMYASINDMLTNKKKGMVEGNIKYFIASINLLEMIGSKEKAEEYKARYNKRLVELVEGHNVYMQKEEDKVYANEENIIDELMKIISEEEKEMRLIIQELK